MASLAAKVEERLRIAAESKSEKQASKMRLVADPMITVMQIQSVFTQFLTWKACSDMWCLISPPPSGAAAANLADCSQWPLALQGGRAYVRPLPVSTEH